MDTKRKNLLIVIAVLAAIGLFLFWLLRGDTADQPMDKVTGTDPFLEEEFDTETIPTVAIAETIGWAKGQAPKAAPGLRVTRFAEGLDHPRTMLTLPNGDVIVALTNSPPRTGPGGITGLLMGYFLDKAGAGDPSPDRLVLLRDRDGDGRAEQPVILREGLHSPSGLAWADGRLYVADHDALLSFPFKPGATRLEGEPDKLMDLPAGGDHWMRNIILSPDGKHIYIAVGSATNIADEGLEAEQGRAMIWEYDVKARSRRPFALGLRNPNGLAWNPLTQELWTTVNERDMLGSDLVPDYLTNVPVGAHYGWPWVYWRKIEDARVKWAMPEFLTEYARKPEYALGPHVAALGLVFAGEGHRLGGGFGNGAFVARHGSWNRKPMSGYDVVFIRFDERGNPKGLPVPVLTGFLTGDGDTHGRPTWLAWDQGGALLVSDDTAGIIWRVIDPQAQPGAKLVLPKYKSLPPQKELKGDPREAFKEGFKF
ncbi:MAG: sorbosone dehydrogenase family protein [Novosphingobium sp.]|nr:sorbosone dehydrogenase family protein [Novosphingobium sp.]